MMRDLTNTVDSKITLGSPLKNQQNMEPSREDQKNFSSSLIDKTLKVGDKWYLISNDWMNRWTNYIGLEYSGIDLKPSNGISVSPGKIDNKNLLNSQKQLKNNLSEEIDFNTVPEELWNYLLKIYGITQEDDVIERYVIDDGDDSLTIEIRPLAVSVSCSESIVKDSVHVEIMSRQTTIEEVVNKIKSSFKVSAALKRPMRLFFRSKDSRVMHPCEINKMSLNSSGYGVQDVIYLEFKNDDGLTWPSDSSVSKSTTKTTTSIKAIPTAPAMQLTSTVTHTPNTRHASASFSNRHHDYRAGLCGLSNLGNTCFMNSSIQMMSNVPFLTDYFRSGKYKSEINPTNPLGRGGQLAESYADLINEMWSGNNSYTMPRNFKMQISRFAPQFTGFQQQDSHELLAFLLDGLHEDLNRIIKKPYVEMGSHVGKTDKEFADESWNDHLKRNDSIIVDLFHGLFKSTLNCLTCNEISIKFDPFCYLSLPLPSKKERLIEVFYVPLDLNTPITKLKLSVLKNGNIGDLCQSLCNILPEVQRNRLVVCDVYTCKFFKIYEQTEQVSLIRDRDDIYIYELSANYNANEYLKVKVHLKEKSTYQYSSTYFGLPLFLTVPKKDLTYGSLFQYILDLLKRFINTDLDDNQQNTSSEEINSKLSDSLNVKDEEFDDDAKNEVDMQTKDEASSQENNLTPKKLFNMIFCKSDNIDYDNHQINEYTDDTPFDWQEKSVGVKESYSFQPTSTSSQIISILADFGQNFNKRFYNKKPIEKYEEHPSLKTQLIKKKDILSLSDCFNLYTKTEKLSENDYWYCSKCKDHVPSTKKFDIWSLPKVLVLQLKRFCYSRNYRDKIDTLVDFPIRDLDLKEYLIQENTDDLCTKYNLIAVSNHYGSLGGGHYTAYGKNRYDNKWYYFDDTSVSSADESNVCTSSVYLLTYIRQDVIGNSNDNVQSSNGQEKMDY